MAQGPRAAPPPPRRSRPSRSALSALATLAPLGGPVLPAPQLGRVGLIAAWEDDSALARFLAGHPVAEGLGGGWHVRLKPVRISGAWPELPELAEHREDMKDDGPSGWPPSGGYA